jgi:hypothetical protein
MATTFVTLFNSPGKIVPIENKTISTDESISNSTYTCNGVIFRNCHFEGNLSVSNASLNYGIKFYNCTFQNLVIDNCTALGYDSSFNDDNNNILLKNCQIKNVLALEGCEVIRGITLQSCSIHTLNIFSIKCTDLLLQSCTVINVSEFSENTITNAQLRLEKSTFDSQIRMQNNKCSTLVLLDSTFKRDIRIWAGEASEGISISRSIFNETLYIESVKSNSGLTLVENEFIKGCKVLYNDSTNNISGGCKNIFIEANDFHTGLFVNDDRKETSVELNSIEIRSSNELKGFIKIDNFLLNNMLLTGINSNCIFTLGTIKIDDLKILNYSNFSTTQFLNISPLSKHSVLKIENSYMGKTHFSNFNFKEFLKISIYNSNVTEITSTNVKWFYNNQVKDLTDEVKRELFRQIKIAMDKQGDRISYLKFHSYEVEAHRRYLNKNNLQIQDRIILWLGLTNQHGQNWIKPVLLATGFTFLFSALIVFCQSDKLSFSIELTRSNLCNTFCVYWNNMAIFWHLLNPAHRLDLIFADQKIRGISLLWDYLSRLFLAFFIYQTISAFRKYSK